MTEGDHVYSAVRTSEEGADGQEEEETAMEDDYDDEQLDDGTDVSVSGAVGYSYVTGSAADVDTDGSGSGCCSSTRSAVYHVLLPAVLLLLALAGAVSLASTLAGIRTQCAGEQWQCWQSAAASRFMAYSFAGHASPSSSSSTFTWSPSSSAGSVNSIRLARVFDRLERGLPIVVGGVGGSNLQGHALNWSETVLPVFTMWLNEHFPVNISNVDALESDRLASQYRDCGNNTRFAAHTTDLPRHVFINAAAGGTTSGITSFCYRRLIAQCDYRPATHSDVVPYWYHDPDIILVDFAVNDIIEDDPFASSPPSTNIERLTRQILGHTSHTAVIMVYFAVIHTAGLVNGEHLHHPVAAHYQVPEVSMRQFAIDWLYEPMYDGDKPDRLPELKEARPVPLGLPLPVVQAMRKLNKGEHVNMDALFWFNGYHLNELGHRVLITLLCRELRILHRALRANNYTSFADPLLLPDGLAASLPSLLDPVTAGLATLPAPLSATLVSSDAQEYVCSVMYYPYNPWAGDINQQQAERFMNIDINRGWVYARHGQSNKFAMAVPEAEAQLVGLHYMRVALPTPIHSLSAVFVRSWNVSQMGEATVWLSCAEEGIGAAAAVTGLVPTPPSTASKRSTPPIRLNGSWAQPNTQLDLAQVWPLHAAHAPANDTQPALECDLQFGHILHTQPGEFRFVGLVYN